MFGCEHARLYMYSITFIVFLFYKTKNKSQVKIIPWKLVPKTFDLDEAKGSERMGVGLGTPTNLTSKRSHVCQPLGHGCAWKASEVGPTGGYSFTMEFSARVVNP